MTSAAKTVGYLMNNERKRIQKETVRDYPSICLERLRRITKNLRIFEFLAAANMKVGIFWVVAPRSLIDVNHVSEMLACRRRTS
jgi:hypothetical protein